MITTTHTGVELAFTSLNQEDTIENLPIQGKLPGWLQGTLYRNGPAKFETGAKSYKHWFDGLAMVHRYRFENGKLSYRNRFLRTTPFNDMERTGELSSGFEFVQPTSLASRLLNNTLDMLGRKTGQTFNTNVSVIRLAGQMLALTEQPVPTAFDADTLDTDGAFYYSDGLFGQLSCGHPQYDWQNDCYYNFLVRFGVTNSYCLYKVNADSTRRELIAMLPVKEPSYMHSFAMTENYIVLTEFPLVFNPLTALLSGKAPKACLEWKPERGTRWRVVSKHTGKTAAEYKSAAMFGFHHINAYEQDGDLVVDLAATDVPALLWSCGLEDLRAATTSAEHPLSDYRRYRLPLSQTRRGTLTGQLVTDQKIEMVTVNAAQTAGRPYRYAYGVSHNTNWHTLVGQLLKIDTHDGSARAWFEPDTYPNEPIFVAAPAACAEDDGVLLSVVLDTTRGKSFLLVLDATTMTELARADLPHHIPLEFHGVFYED